MSLEWLGYLELINTFSFREKCSIKIPKSIRERAFSLQLDIEILSTAGNDYVNDKSIPAYGFYGYAVLVMRDFSQIQIPINQPRQVLYYERVEEAYANWYNLFLFQALREWSKGLSEVIGQIGQAVGLGEYTVPPAPCLPWGGFEEIPLREVYIKTRYGTRFSLEISHWRPITRSGDTDCDYDPISRQNDGDKDDGLPPDGVQPPNNGIPSSPYDGFPSPSTSSELGDFFNDDKLDGMDNPNPENEPSDLLWWLRIQSSIKRTEFPNGCATRRILTTHLAIASGDIDFEVRPKPSFPPTPTGCGGTTSRLQQIKLTGGDWFDYDFEDSDVPLLVEKQSGYAIPTDSLVFQ